MFTPTGTSRRSRIHINLRSEEHTSELQSQSNLVCRLLLEKKKHALEPALRRKRRPHPRSLIPLEFTLPTRCMAPPRVDLRAEARTARTRPVGRTPRTGPVV